MEKRRQDKGNGAFGAMFPLRDCLDVKHETNMDAAVVAHAGDY